MLTYKNLQKLIMYLKKCSQKSLNNIKIYNVEYQNLFDDEDDKDNILLDLIINDDEMYSDYEDIIILDCNSLNKAKGIFYFRIKLLLSDDNFLIYISYVPGNSHDLHNIVSKEDYKWESIVPGYLMLDFNDYKRNYDLKNNNVVYEQIINSLNNTIKTIGSLIN